jgi:hypothetical protein
MMLDWTKPLTGAPQHWLQRPGSAILLKAICRRQLWQPAALCVLCGEMDCAALPKRTQRAPSLLIIWSPQSFAAPGLDKGPAAGWSSGVSGALQTDAGNLALPRR